MICPRCGRVLRDNAVVCNNCGEQFAPDEPDIYADRKTHWRPNPRRWHKLTVIASIIVYVISTIILVVVSLEKHANVATGQAVDTYARTEAVYTDYSLLDAPYVFGTKEYLSATLQNVAVIEGDLELDFSVTNERWTQDCWFDVRVTVGETQLSDGIRLYIKGGDTVNTNSFRLSLDELREPGQPSHLMGIDVALTVLDASGDIPLWHSDSTHVTFSHSYRVNQQ